MIRTNKLFVFAALSVATLFTACKKETLIEGGNGLTDWTAESHGYGASPNYDIVFNQNEVQRLDFVIEADYWQAMQEDVESLYGGNVMGATETPIYVPAQMFHNGKQWYDVGLRYKGNSTLRDAYQNGSGKLPFRIEMNHFESENPNINGQTFHGFTQLSLSSNYRDDSYIHEKVAADVFRSFGVPAPQTAFYRIYIDHGDGPIYFGLYTMVEVAFDTPMLDTQFGSSYGNCYKPDGEGARFNDLGLITSTSFPNKNNEGASLDDINSFVTALLSDTRTSDPGQWRSDLEQTLDVNQFLKWLAVNTTIQNWDTYGKMTHNFYMYNNPSTNKLVWMPWDNNEAFADPTGGPGGSSALDFDYSNLETMPPGPDGDPAWPLISYLYNDPVYRVQYDDYIDDFIGQVTVSDLTNQFNNAHNLIEPYVTGSEGENAGYTSINAASFASSVSTLTSFVSTRWTEADNYTP